MWERYGDVDACYVEQMAMIAERRLDSLVVPRWLAGQTEGKGSVPHLRWLLLAEEEEIIRWAGEIIARISGGG